MHQHPYPAPFLPGHITDLLDQHEHAYTVTTTPGSNGRTVSIQVMWPIGDPSHLRSLTAQWHFPNRGIPALTDLRLTQGSTTRDIVSAEAVTAIIRKPLPQPTAAELTVGALRREVQAAGLPPQTRLLVARHGDAHLTDPVRHARVLRSQDNPAEHTTTLAQDESGKLSLVLFLD